MESKTMIGYQFYPTPIAVIKKMLAPYIGKAKYRDEFNGSMADKIILEPSAGKGTIVEYINEYFRHSSKPDIYCIESDPELLHILRHKEFRVIHDDFLTYSGDHYFNLIVMNPPFAEGDKHLLKAWDVLSDGDIVCLLNAETINNPLTESRQLLAKVIADNNGTVENLDHCFKYTKFDKRKVYDGDDNDYSSLEKYGRLEDPEPDDDFTIEREADVEVVMVRLHKTEKESRFDFIFESVSKEKGARLSEESLKDPIAVRDVIGNIILQYDKTKDIFIEFIKIIKALQFYGDPIVTEYAKLKEMALKAWEEGGTSQQKYNSFVDSLRSEAWQQIFKTTNFVKYMTHGLRTRFDKFASSQGNMDLTKENIWNLLKMIVDNRETIMEDCITDVFEIFTRYHDDNRVHIEGWKTNDAYKVNKKIILPRAVKYGSYMTASGDRFSMEYSTHSEYSDIDKCMCYIMGVPWETCNGIYESIDRLFHTIGHVRTGEKFDNECSSTFFHIKFWKKGTIHLTFRNEKLWEQFNIRACWKKQWLRPGVDFDGKPCDEQGIRLELSANNPAPVQEQRLIEAPKEPELVQTELF